MLQQEMAGLRCLSCEHDNQAGAKFCVQCGSRLNLKLCGSCEAINDAGAERCHNCGGRFPVAPASVQLSGAHFVEPNNTGAAGKSVRLYHADFSPDKQSRGRSPRVRALLMTLLVAAIGGVVSYFHGESLLEPAARDHAKAPAPKEAETAPDTEEPQAEPSVAAAKPAAEVPPQESVPLTQPVISSQGRVTHTAGVGAAPSGATYELKTAPLVTHTKGFVAPRIVADGELKHAAAAHVDARETAVAAETSKPDSAVELKQEQTKPGACTEVVTALGLCN